MAWTPRWNVSHSQNVYNNVITFTRIDRSTPFNTSPDNTLVDYDADPPLCYFQFYLNNNEHIIIYMFFEIVDHISPNLFGYAMGHLSACFIKLRSSAVILAPALTDIVCIVFILKLCMMSRG